MQHKSRMLLKALDVAPAEAGVPPEAVRDDTVPKASGCFFYLSLLTSFFFLLEISFFVQCNKAYLGDFRVVAHYLPLPVSILPGICFFILAQLLLHAAYCGLVWAGTKLAAKSCHLHANQTITLGLVLWTTGILALILANQVFFPYSKFSELTAFIFFNPIIARAVLILLCLFCLAVLSLALIEIIKWMMGMKKNTGMF